MTLKPSTGCCKRKRPVLKKPTAAALFVVLSWLANPVGIGQAWGQNDLPVVGVLTVLSVTDEPRLEAMLNLFNRSLEDRGWVADENLLIEYRSAQGDPARLAGAVESLVKLNADVIFAVSAPALRAAHAQTPTLPIVRWDYTTDPVAEGYVQSYARPGGNITGVFLDAPAFSGTWLEMLREVVPDLTRVAVLWDPGPGDAHLRAIKSIAPSFNMELQIIEVRKPEDIDIAGATFRERPQAIVILPSPMTYAQTTRLVKLANGKKLPAVSIFHEFAAAGGLFAYGPDIALAIERNAALIAKILDGSDPAEVPVERPTKIRFAVNVNTAKALGLTIPQSILLRADEVIR